jgi:hypothetical protein
MLIVAEDGERALNKVLIAVSYTRTRKEIHEFHQFLAQGSCRIDIEEISG